MSLFRSLLLLGLLVGAMARPAAAGPYADYFALLEKAEKGALAPEDVSRFRMMLHERQIFPASLKFKKTGQLEAFSDALFAVPSTDVLYDFLRQQSEAVLFSSSEKWKPGVKGRLFAWHWGYWGRAAVYLYKATGEKRFIDFFISTYGRILDERDDRIGLVDDARKRIVPGWGTRYPNGARAVEVTTTGLITLPVCEALADPEIRPMLPARFASETAEALDLFLGEIEPAGFMRHKSEPYIEPLNHAHVYAAAMIYCRRHVPGQGREARYDSAIRKISAFYRSAIRVGPGGGLSWAYMPRLDAPTTGRAEGFWKASVTVELPIAGRKASFLFTQKDIAGIAVTVRSLDRNGRIAQFFDSREPFLVKEKRFSGSSLPGQLAVFFRLRDRNTTQVVLNIMRQNPQFFPNGWFGGSRAMVMGLAVLLRDKAYLGGPNSPYTESGKGSGD